MAKNHVRDTVEGKAMLAKKDQEMPMSYWGPYLSERQWGTVREDYSEKGNPWEYFPHDHARSRAYLWGEDGLGGISDYGQNLCFAIALWNGKDPILKERLFGLNNHEGNHGEDVKELYYYLDNVPSHNYMKFLYKLPQQEYPYLELIEKSKTLSKTDPEFEILDTGIFDDGRYFDINIEYAKAAEHDIYIRVTAKNLGGDAAPLTILPTLWFYNRWQYGGLNEKPALTKKQDGSIQASHERIGDYFLYMQDDVETLFTENETNFQRLFGTENKSEFVKDAFHDAIINGERLEELKAKTSGTKCAAVYQHTIEAGGEKTIYLRLTNMEQQNAFATDPNSVFQQRKKEADEFYNAIITDNRSEDIVNIQRQAFAGLLWSKQYYHYDVQRWLHHSDGITPLTERTGNGQEQSLGVF